MRSCRVFFLKKLFSLLLFFSVPAIVYGESGGYTADELRIPDSNQLQILTTPGGSRLIGRIIKIRATEIDFKTDLGIQTIAIGLIKEIEEIPVSLIKEGEYWFPNPNTTRLFFAPTGRMMKKGQGYFCDYYLFFPGVAWGITDNLTIGLGISLFPWLDFAEQIIYFTPKLGVAASRNVRFATGALIVTIPDWNNDDESHTVGILYGVSTLGSDDHNFTAGLGYGFADGELADKPMVMFGGEFRIARRAAFVTENWIFPELDNPLISYGVRFFGEALSVDLALVTVTGEDAIVPGIPYIDFVFNF